MAHDGGGAETAQPVLTEAEHLAYCAWCHVEHRQHELVPSGKSTWREWWRRRFRQHAAAVKKRVEWDRDNRGA